MIKKLHTSALLVTTAVAFSAPTFAYEAGDILLRAGVVTVAPESKSDDIDQLPGEAVSANDNSQVGISGTYMITDKVGIEVLAATPFNHKITAKGGALDGNGIGEVTHLPPTVSAQYYFLEPQSALQPYVGAGLNITVFFDEKTDSDVEGLGYDSLSLDESFGLAVQAGVDYTINEEIFVNASVMYAKIGTTATLEGTAGTLTVDYDLDPLVYRVNFGYKF